MLALSEDNKMRMQVHEYLEILNLTLDQFERYF